MKLEVLLIMSYGTVIEEMEVSPLFYCRVYRTTGVCLCCKL